MPLSRRDQTASDWPRRFGSTRFRRGAWDEQWARSAPKSLAFRQKSPGGLFRSDAMGAGEVHQGIISNRDDGREVAMCDEVRARELGDVIGDRAQRQIDDLARIGGDVRCRG